MTNYSKLIGTIVGFALGYAVTKFGLPESLGSQEIISAVTLILTTAAGTFLAPANKPKV